MIARLGWSALFALLAGIAVLAQIDRTSRQQPGLARLVPAALQGFAARHEAAQALAAREGEQAMAKVRRLIRARPLPAEHLSMAAQAATLTGEEALALAALEEGARRGWRDPLAQQVAAQGALAAGDREAAAPRIAALLATGVLPEETGTLLAALLAEPEGRQAFAALLAAEGRWQNNFPAFAAQAIAPAPLAETLSLAQAQGARLPCARLETIARTYREGGLETDAARFWPGPCA